MKGIVLRFTRLAGSSSFNPLLAGSPAALALSRLQPGRPPPAQLSRILSISV